MNLQTPEQCQSKAAECERKAEQAPYPDVARLFWELADQWRQIAALSARYGPSGKWRHGDAADEHHLLTPLNPHARAQSGPVLNSDQDAGDA